MSDLDLSSPDAHDHLITNVKALAGKLIRTANYHKNLSSLKAHEQLVHKIKEIFFELEQQDGKLRDTLKTSEFVLRNLENLMTSLVDVETFFDGLTKITIMMFAKSSAERKLQNLLHSLRGKMTQLMTSISLELLSRTAPKPKEAPKAPNSMECNIGFSYFYGIGKPRNLTTAFEKFLEGAESGDTESMYMLSMCYSESLGTDKDEGAARAWLEKAATCGNPNAMTELAVILMNSVDHRDPQLLADVLRSIVTQEPQSTARKPPVYPKTRKPETDTSYIDDEVNAIDRVEERFSQNSRQWLRRNSATNIDAQRKGITGASTAADRRPSDALSPFSPSRRRASESDYQGSPAMEDKSNDFNEFDETEETQAQIREREEADLQMAVKLLLQAAERNFATAMTNLGNAFEVAGDFVHAAKWYEKASECGCPRATNKLGLLHFHGRGVGGVGIDKEKALAYFASAARAGDSDAHNNAGTCLEQDIGLGMGIGLPSHLAKALASEDVRPSRALWYYERGARMGSAQAMYSYGYLLLRSAIKAIEALQAVASGSMMERERTAARVREFLLLPYNQSEEEEIPKTLPSESANFAVHDFDVPKTPFPAGGKSRLLNPEPSELERAERQAREGVRWLRAAAERNIKEARYQLGLVYEQGIGCPVDIPSALAQFEYAARQGHAKAALSAANLLYDALCIAEATADAANSSADASYSLNTTAAELSILQARREVGASPAVRRRMSKATMGALSIGWGGDISVSATGSGKTRTKERDLRRIASLYRQAAEAGLPSAMNSLGLLVEDGRAVADGRPNPSGAAAWYYEASIYGLAEGFINLAMVLATRTVREFRTVHSDRIINAVEAKNWMQDKVAEGNGVPKGVSMTGTMAERFSVLLQRLDYVLGDDFVLSDTYMQRITSNTQTPSRITEASQMPPPASIQSTPRRQGQGQQAHRRSETSETPRSTASASTRASNNGNAPQSMTPPRPDSEHRKQGRNSTYSKPAAQPAEQDYGVGSRTRSDSRHSSNREEKREGDREYLEGPLGLPIALPKASGRPNNSNSNPNPVADRNRDGSSHPSSQVNTPLRSRALSGDSDYGAEHGIYQYNDASGEFGNAPTGVASSAYVPGAVRQGAYNADEEFGSYGGTHGQQQQQEGDDDGSEEEYEEGEEEGFPRATSRSGTPSRSLVSDDGRPAMTNASSSGSHHRIMQFGPQAAAENRILAKKAVSSNSRDLASFGVGSPLDR